MFRETYTGRQAHMRAIIKRVARAMMMKYLRRRGANIGEKTRAGRESDWGEMGRRKRLTAAVDWCERLFRIDDLVHLGLGDKRRLGTWLFFMFEVDLEDAARDLERFCLCRVLGMPICR